MRIKLSEAQHEQLQQCFQLMDEDGSGNIDGRELGNAFKVEALQFDLGHTHPYTGVLLHAHVQRLHPGCSC